MPRSYIVTVDRSLVDRVTPGVRVTIVGVFSILNRMDNVQSGDQVKISYIRALGIQREFGDSNQGFNMPNITEEDKIRIKQLSQDPEIYKKISSSIGGAIYGQDDVKKAIACLLFGGTPKKLPDGMKLRGEINILLLGDPSTAKS